MGTTSRRLAALVASVSFLSTLVVCSCVPTGPAFVFAKGRLQDREGNVVSLNTLERVSRPGPLIRLEVDGSESAAVLLSRGIAPLVDRDYARFLLRERGDNKWIGMRTDPMSCLPEPPESPPSESSPSSDWMNDVGLRGSAVATFLMNGRIELLFEAHDIASCPSCAGSGVLVRVRKGLTTRQLLTGLEALDRLGFERFGFLLCE